MRAGATPASIATPPRSRISSPHCCSLIRQLRWPARCSARSCSSSPSSPCSTTANTYALPCAWVCSPRFGSRCSAPLDEISTGTLPSSARFLFNETEGARHDQRRHIVVFGRSTLDCHSLGGLPRHLIVLARVPISPGASAAASLGHDRVSLKAHSTSPLRGGRTAEALARGGSGGGSNGE